ESIKAAQPYLEMTRKLVRLATDVPLKVDWDAWKLQPAKTAELRKLFFDWGFTTLLRQLHDESAPEGARQQSLFDGAELFPFGANAPPGEGGKEEAAPPAWQADYRLIDTPEAFEGFFKQLQTQKRFAVDLETT